MTFKGGFKAHSGKYYRQTDQFGWLKNVHHIALTLH
jgi:hypothetical protein